MWKQPKCLPTETEGGRERVRESIFQVSSRQVRTDVHNNLQIKSALFPPFGGRKWDLGLPPFGIKTKTATEVGQGLWADE